jgi:glutaredoxin 2
MNEVNEAKEDIPVVDSMRGDNTHYIGCDVRGARQNYAVCLHRNKAFEEDRLDSKSCVDCQRAIVGKYCPALALRKEEEAAGKALYYVPRIPVKAVTTSTDSSLLRSNVDKNSESYKRGYQIPSGKIAKPSAKTVTRPRSNGKAYEQSQAKSAHVKPVVKQDKFTEAMKNTSSMADVINADVKTQKPVVKKSKAVEIAKRLMEARNNA